MSKFYACDAHPRLRFELDKKLSAKGHCMTSDCVSEGGVGGGEEEKGKGMRGIVRSKEGTSRVKKEGVRGEG